MVRGFWGSGCFAKLRGYAVFEVHHVVGFTKKVDIELVVNYLVAVATECVRKCFIEMSAGVNEVFE